jgi:GDPmannose 4,6-dehydratase
MLEAVLHVDPTIRFCQAGSSRMFGNVERTPQDEQTPMRPCSPYGAAKAYGHWIVVNYRESHNAFACSAILFGHESPRRSKSFVSRKVSDAAARIKLGIEDGLVLGNLDVGRDWGFAGDYVDACWRMLQQDRPDDYVVASGETHSIRELLDVAFGHVGLDWRKYVVTDPKLFRRSESNAICGDASKARRVLGWKPRVSFDQLIHAMVDADLEQVHRGL